MKSFRNYFVYLSYILFITGAFLKFFRTPFHTVIMLVGIGGLLIASILYFISKNKALGIITLSGFFLASLYVSIVKFLPSMVLVIGSATTVLLVIIVLIRTKKFYISHHLILSFILAISLIMGAMPRDARYFLLNIKYNTHIDKDYTAWDKYSWFLNGQGKQTEAIKANEKSWKIVQSTDDEKMKELIRRHKQLLSENKWEKYR